MLAGPAAPEAKPNSVISKVLPIIPSERNKAKEMQERIQTRSLTSAALVGQAVADLGGELLNPLSATRLVQVDAKTGPPRLLHLGHETQLLSKIPSGYKISKSGWHNTVRSWAFVRELAITAMGRKLASDDSVGVSWRDVLDASQANRQNESQLNKRIKGLLPAKLSTTHTPILAPSAEPSDPVVAKLRKSKDLSAHEKRLLGCIVDAQKVATTSFQDVHLPFKTIDAIRTIISLPLLFPAAFQGGVLKDHSTQGALLFGPPGTGKTLCARAVANESGARMLAIQPSDVNDKYFGEGEKLYVLRYDGRSL